LTRALRTEHSALLPVFLSPKEPPMQITMTHMPAILAILIGILILIVPRFLNYLVAIYLIVTGLIGLNILRF
jgi:hypothetical protein